MVQRHMGLTCVGRVAKNQSSDPEFKLGLQLSGITMSELSGHRSILSGRVKGQNFWSGYNSRQTDRQPKEYKTENFAMQPRESGNEIARHPVW